MSQELIDAVREACARVADRHINLRRCRQLFGEGGPGAFSMASHLSTDIRAAIVEDDPRVKSASEQPCLCPFNCCKSALNERHYCRREARGAA